MKAMLCNVCKKILSESKSYSVVLANGGGNINVSEDFDVCPECAEKVATAIRDFLYKEQNSVGLQFYTGECKQAIAEKDLKSASDIIEESGVISNKAPTSMPGIDICPKEEKVSVIPKVPKKESDSKGKGNYKKHEIDKDDYEEIVKQYNDGAEEKEISKDLRIVLSVVKAAVDSSSWEEYQNSLSGNAEDGKLTAEQFSKIKDLQQTNFSVDSTAKYMGMKKGIIKKVYECDSYEDFSTLDEEKIKQLAVVGWFLEDIAKECNCTKEEVISVLKKENIIK